VKQFGIGLFYGLNGCFSKEEKPRTKNSQIFKIQNQLAEILVRGKIDTCRPV
jgi:hypothetical protein